MVRIVAVANKNHRRDRRRTAQRAAVLNADEVEILDISLGGLGGSFVELTSDHDQFLKPGDQAILRLTCGDGEEACFTVEIAHCDSEGLHFGASFLGLDDRQYRLIERLTMGRPI